jgi:hypothetical protein
MTESYHRILRDRYLNWSSSASARNGVAGTSALPNRVWERGGEGSNVSGWHRRPTTPSICCRGRALFAAARHLRAGEEGPEQLAFMDLAMTPVTDDEDLEIFTRRRRRHSSSRNIGGSMRTSISTSTRPQRRGTHATRVLAIATSRSRTFKTQDKDCFGESPKPARESRALPRGIRAEGGGQFFLSKRRRLCMVRASKNRWNPLP